MAYKNSFRNFRPSSFFLGSKKTGNVHTNVTLRRVRVTLLPWQKKVTFSECVSVVIVIQHAKSIRLLATLAPPILFRTASHKRHDFLQEESY